MSQIHVWHIFLKQSQTIDFYSPLSRDRNTNVQIIITIFQETTVFLIFSTFFCVGHRKVMVFADKPVTKTTVFNNTVESARHTLALLICDVEFLISDQELRTGRLTRSDLSLLVITFSGKSKTILLKRYGQK